MAATLLHKAMEYETLSPAEELSNLNADEPFSATFTLESANTVTGLLRSVEELSIPQSHEEPQIRKNLEP